MTSINFGLRKKRKIEVPPQAFSDPDGDSDEHNTVEDIEAHIRLLQVTFMHSVITRAHIHFPALMKFRRTWHRRRAAGMLKMGNILLPSEHGIVRLH